MRKIWYFKFKTWIALAENFKTFIKYKTISLESEVNEKKPLKKLNYYEFLNISNILNMWKNKFHQIRFMK